MESQSYTNTPNTPNTPTKITNQNTEIYRPPQASYTTGMGNPFICHSGVVMQKTSVQRENVWPMNQNPQSFQRGD